MTTFGFALSIAEVYDALIDHEWEYTDDRKHVVCMTCGARHTARKFENDKLSLGHADGCHYAILVAAVADDLDEAGDDE